MRRCSFVLTLISACCSGLAFAEEPAQTEPELPAPGHCPRSASAECAQKLEAYANAYADLGRKADDLFDTADGTLGNQFWKDTPSPQLWREAELQLSKVTDGRKNVTDSLTRFKGGVTALEKKFTEFPGLKYIVDLNEAISKKDAYNAAFADWTSDRQDKIKTTALKAAKQDYLKAIQTADADGKSWTAEVRSRFQSELDAFASQIAEVNSSLSNLQAMIAPNDALAKYAPAVRDKLQGRYEAFRNSYSAAKIALDAATLAGAKMGTPGQAPNTVGARELKIIAAFYGQGKSVTYAFERWNAALKELDAKKGVDARKQMDTEIDDLRTSLMSGEMAPDGFDAKHRVCDASTYVTTTCIYTDVQVPLCLVADYAKTIVSDPSKVDDLQPCDKDKYNTPTDGKRRILRVKAPAVSACGFKAKPDSLCGGPVSPSPTFHRSLIIVYQCGSGPRQLSVAANNQDVYLLCDRG